MSEGSGDVTRRLFLAAGAALPAEVLGAHGRAQAAEPLPAIPVFDARHVGLVGLAEARVPEMRTLLKSCLGSLDDAERLSVGVADGLARTWLRATGTPYAAELDAIAPLLPEPGLYLLNASYEWGCTALAAPAPDGRSARLLRTLDWSFAGLGRGVVAVRQHGDAGDFVNITWPGAVGALTGLAPGRFAATINQAPEREGTGEGDPAGVFGGLSRVLARHALPAMHLMRGVFERARDFEEARAMIETTPIAAPTIFTLIGTAPDATCVIERTECDHVTHRGVSSAANSWHYADFRDGWAGRDVDDQSDSAERRRHIEASGPPARAPFAWVAPPVRNGRTRLAVELDAGRGTLAVRGYEATGEGDDAAAVTADLHLVP